MDQLEKFFKENQVVQDSERIFVREFMIPLIGLDNVLKYLKPQYPFIDQTGRERRIDFAINDENFSDKIAFEIDGESYHAEGAVSSEYFDDSLFRQNELVMAGWNVLRFSFTQLQDPKKREYVSETLKLALRKFTNLVSSKVHGPNELQKKALKALAYTRDYKKQNKGVVIMPTGTGKTYLSAMDMKRYLKSKGKSARGLFIVHNLEILRQSRAAYFDIFGDDVKLGILNGKQKENLFQSKVLFASKDSLVSKENIKQFKPTEFSYIVVDEVQHAAAKTYKKIFEYFKPQFMLGMTATPERHDRKDIMELFNYQKIIEFSLNDAIENDFLVQVEYHGLTDDVDYTKIRHNGFKYNMEDLDRYLNIQSRNQEILNKYQELLQGSKTIAFCVGKSHADKMADLFNQNGIKSIAIYSGNGKDDTEKRIERFRNNEFNVAFVVDMFNEGVDIPNVRGLMFLRPTESKTIFIQQLGRGLRLSLGKEKTIVLDFIGNYYKVNRVREWLSNGKKKKVRGSDGRLKEVYDYGKGMKVEFSDKVEQLMDQQSMETANYSKQELEEEYYVIKDKRNGKRVNKFDWINNSNIPLSVIVKQYGSWHKFIESLGELTESSYHYPQGTSLGHILYIMQHLSNDERKDTLISEEYVRLTGSLSKSPDGKDKKQRQTKYKLQALMELGLIEDARKTHSNDLILTKIGKKFCKTFKPLLDNIDLSMKTKGSWTLRQSEDYFNTQILNYIDTNKAAFDLWINLMLNFDAFVQYLHVIYFEYRTIIIKKKKLYDGFFESPFVRRYIDNNGIKESKGTNAAHRVPLLSNIAASIGLIDIQRSTIAVKKILLNSTLLRISDADNNECINERLRLAKYPQKTSTSNEVEAMKELFGPDFGTKNFKFNSKDMIIIGE